MATSGPVDTIIIGGGPAGLQAALTLGRMRQDVLLVDSGEYRNGAVEHSHNLITHDGRSPEELRDLARKDLAAYPTVELRTGKVETVAADGADFVAVVDGETVRARTVVLATGLRDLLPDVPGLQEIWGVEAAQCPFCHGFEVADQPIAVLGTNGHIGMYASMLGLVSRDLVLLSNGDDVDEINTGIVTGLGGRVISAPVLGVERVGGGARIALEGAGPVEVAGVFVASVTFEQSAPFAEQLGLALLPSGAIEIDVMGSTSVPGVYAAGDLAHVAALPMPMPSLATSISAGLVAGSSCVRDLLGRR